MGTTYIGPTGGLSKEDKETAKQWMVEGHSILRGKVQGTVPARAAATITPGTTNQTIPAGVYLSGEQTVVGSDNLVPENIRSGVSIFGVTGTYVGCYYLGNGRSFNVSSIMGYNNFTVNNFIVQPLTASSSNSGNASADWWEQKAYVRYNASSGINKSYDQSTGVFTCNGYVSCNANGGAGSIGASASGTGTSDCNVYLIVEALNL